LLFDMVRANPRYEVRVIRDLFFQELARFPRWLTRFPPVRIGAAVCSQGAPVPATETIFAGLIFVVLFCLALYFGRQQMQTLRWLRTQPNLPPEDERYARRQIKLRLIGCGLLVVLGSQVGAAYLFGLEARIHELAQDIQRQKAQGEQVNLTPDQRALRTVYGIYWIAALVVLLTIVFLAAYDIWAIRRYGRRHLRQIHDERRAMLQDEVARLRTDRNGHT
jgi:uncharacterized small protein (DUF1192 family)